MSGVSNWDRYDDEEIHQHRVSTRYGRAMRFLDEAVEELETATPLAQEAADLSESQPLGAGDEKTD